MSDLKVTPEVENVARAIADAEIMEGKTVLDIIGEWSNEFAGLPEKAIEEAEERLRSVVALAAMEAMMEPSDNMTAAIADSAQRVCGTDTEDWKASAWDKLAGYRTMMLRAMGR